MPGPLILLIDDEENLLFALKAVMQRAGFECITARNGSQGLNAAQTYHPDLIISDVMMPPPNGFELRKLLAKEPRTAWVIYPPCCYYQQS